MPRTSDKRERLVDSAKSLFHRQGYYRTSLADIARESDVPLGNVYYYFKTKEDICNAVIDERRESIRESLQECRCKDNDPKQNLVNAIKMIMKQSNTVAEYGCPVGSLCQELDKTPSALSEAANQCLQEHIQWAAKQFRQLGYQNAHDLGVEFMARIQGTILLGHTLHDPSLIRKQLRSACEWIESL